LSDRLQIPVFHDDQHGTAICVAAAVRNGLRLANKQLNDVRLVCSGAGAAALSCLDLLVSMGLDREQVFVCDRHGVVHTGRDIEEDPYKSRYARTTELRTLQEVMPGADIFLGLSAGGVLDAGSVAVMAANPLILALANPDPEIMPETAHAVRDDIIIATGRSDYPNQVNNVLCFPFLFRGALDVCATTINQPMMIACVEALADLALEETSDSVAAAYSGETFRFSRDYLLPKPFDRRLISRISVRVAEAAMNSGVAMRPIPDLGEYRQHLEARSYRTSTLMRPIFDRARQHPGRIMFAEGESTRVLQAIQVIVDENLCMPVLAGRRDVIGQKLAQSGLRLESDRDFEIIDPDDNGQLPKDRECLRQILGKDGPTDEQIYRFLQGNGTVLAAARLRRRTVDAALCGVNGHFAMHLAEVRRLVGCADDISDLSTINLVITRQGPLFITDTRITAYPTVKQLADSALLAVGVVERFGIHPSVALLAQPVGEPSDEEVHRIDRAVALLRERTPGLPVNGPVSVAEALSSLPGNHPTLEKSNILVMPNRDAAAIALGVMKTIGNSVDGGPMLTGARYPVHILGNDITVLGIVNMTALAAAGA